MRYEDDDVGQGRRVGRITRIKGRIVDVDRQIVADEIRLISDRGS
jgi:hypothetical protein